jgi:ferredoxin, 2Fe-2S
MAKITVKNGSGAPHEFEGREGVSLMENLRAAGRDELLAMCGGCLSCATCHVYVEFAPLASKLPEMSVDENELLDASEHRQAASRLSCQIPFSASLDGIVVTIAPQD